MASGDLLERVRAHFEAQPVRRLEVPEWGAPGAPLEVYCKPWTLAERSRARKALKERDMRGWVDVILAKAVGADGKPLFNVDAEPVLMGGASSVVVERVAEWLFLGISQGEDAPDPLA